MLHIARDDAQEFEDLSSYSSSKEYNKRRKNRRGHTVLKCILGVFCALLIVFGSGLIYIATHLLDDPDQSVDGDTDDDDNTNDDDDVEDTTGDTTFLMPVDEVNAVNSYGFYHNTTLDKYYLHTGIDFAGDVGDEVYAALDGTVESITSDPVLMGTTITLSHENGLKTTYTFVDAAEGLAVGDTVEKGDVIATVAEAMGQEYKDGAHLHFEVFLNDEAVDPETYLDIDSK